MIVRWLFVYLPKYYIDTVKHSILVIIFSPKSFSMALCVLTLLFQYINQFSLMCSPLMSSAI